MKNKTNHHSLLSLLELTIAIVEGEMKIVAVLVLALKVVSGWWLIRVKMCSEMGLKP